MPPPKGAESLRGRHLPDTNGTPVSPGLGWPFDTTKSVCSPGRRDIISMVARPPSLSLRRGASALSVGHQGGVVGSSIDAPPPRRPGAQINPRSPSNQSSGRGPRLVLQDAYLLTDG